MEECLLQLFCPLARTAAGSDDPDSSWDSEREKKRAEADALAASAAQARRENAVAQHKALILRGDERNRALTCQVESPETWPFRISDKDKNAVCWHHKSRICTFCCMDFAVINKLRRNQEYLALCNKPAHEQERLRIVESTTRDYYERIKKVGENPATKHSPFMTVLEAGLDEEDSFRRIALAAYHCFDARSSSPPANLSRELDTVVQAMERMQIANEPK